MTLTVAAALALHHALATIPFLPAARTSEASPEVRLPAWWHKAELNSNTILDRPAFGRSRRFDGLEAMIAPARLRKPGEPEILVTEIALPQESIVVAPPVEPPTDQVTTTTTTTSTTTTTTTVNVDGGERSRLTPADIFHRGPTPETVDPYEHRVTVQVQDMDVAAVLSTLSEEIDLNLVLQSATDKKLTLNLRDTPFSDVLRTICSLTDLYSVRLPSMVIVGSKEALESRYPAEFARAYPAQTEATTEMRREIIRLNFVDSVEAATVLRSQWKEEELKIGIGPMHFSPGATDGSTMGTGNGILQGSGNATGSQANPTTPADGSIAGNPASKTLVLYGAATVVSEAMALIANLDRPRPQVVVSVSIVDVRNDKLDELGIKWDFGNFSLTENSPPGIGVMPFQRSGFNFQASISALVRDGAAKVLAEPNVGVMDGRSAYVLIGDKLKFPELVGRDANNQPIFSTREERVGIYLQVAPTIASDGTVTMSIFPQVSTVTGFTDFQGIGRYPIISARESRSSVAVRDGDSIIIGGLIQEQDIRTWQEVPILSRIPFFGELFRWRSNNRVSSQVIITITPRIVWPENHAPGTLD